MTNDKQRERLVELLKETFDYTRGTCIDFDEAVEINADYLLANGVIAPPVIMGQEIYHIEEYNHSLIPDEYPTVKVVCKSEVEKIFIEKYGNSFGDTRKCFDFDDFGKTVFLTKEEAENALGGVQG